MRSWWEQLRVGAAALRGPLVVGAVVLAFVLGGVAAEADDEDQPRVVHVEAIPAPSLDRLVAATTDPVIRFEPHDP